MFFSMGRYIIKIEMRYLSIDMKFTQEEAAAARTVVLEKVAKPSCNSLELDVYHNVPHAHRQSGKEGD